ncbi:MAG TPA: GxxExxY protein, partial [Abditibacteriaceae bacterium]
MALEHEELTGAILAAAVSVHRALGPGFIEAIYEKALVIELRRRGLKVLQQVEIEVSYEGIVVGTHRLDLIIEDTIILELKA